MMHWSNFDQNVAFFFGVSVSVQDMISPSPPFSSWIVRLKYLFVF